MNKQIQQLKYRPRIIIGTPGRINDHLNRGTLNLSRAEFMVLDEADRMLDMGFGEQIDEILTYIPENIQTLMFSATLPKEILSIANQYLTDPVRVSVGSTEKPAVNIEQEVVRVNNYIEKYKLLISELEKREGSVLIFTMTKMGSEELTERLKEDHHSVDFLHGDLRQHQRSRVTRNFRNKKFRILVATDIAARGLDIPHIEHVINFDLPQAPEDFIHRIGRTARAGATGSALTIIGPQDKHKWNAIERLLYPEKKQKEQRSQKRFSKPQGRRSKSQRTFGKKRRQNFSSR